MTKPKNRPSLRLYCPETLTPGMTLPLSDDQAHYVFKVLRRTNGDQIGLFNAANGEYAATLHQTSKRAGTAILGDSPIIAPAPPQANSLTLYFAPLKRTQTELLVQKATELGVTSLQPVLTEHTRAEKLRLERLETIALEACEQCERLAPPEILAPRALAELLACPTDNVLLYAAEAGESRPLPRVLLSEPCANAKALGLLVGPEGGFSPREFDRLGQTAEAIAVGLGPRILKAETAAISGLAVIQALWGDFDQKPDFRGTLSAI